MAAIGVLGRDGGVVPGLALGWVLFITVGWMLVQITPIALTVWQANGILSQALHRSNQLNRELRWSGDQLRASRRRVVTAADEERRRIERDLHDGAQQRLVTLGVRLRLLAATTPDDSPLRPEIDGLIEELDGAVDELRELAHGIYPPILESQGLGRALSAVARRATVAVDLRADDIGRLGPAAEAGLYFVALEALTNAAKHAPGCNVVVDLSDRDGAVRLEVSDDGPGFDTGAGDGPSGVDGIVTDDGEQGAPADHPRSGHDGAVGGSHGTRNMGDRIAAVGGRLTIESAPGHGTTVLATVPRGDATSPSSDITDADLQPRSGGLAR